MSMLVQSVLLCTKKNHINIEISMGQDGTDTSGNILRKQVDEQISEKIRELEDCAAQTKEVSKVLEIIIALYSSKP